jgi:hypothetical protein
MKYVRKSSSTQPVLPDRELSSIFVRIHVDGEALPTVFYQQGFSSSGLRHHSYGFDETNTPTRHSAKLRVMHGFVFVNPW